jgi:hypothetical protein
MFDEGGKSSYLFSHHLLQIHLLNHHYHFTKKRGRKRKKKMAKSFFSIIRFPSAATRKEKNEFNLKAGDENSGNIRFDFPFSRLILPRR